MLEPLWKDPRFHRYPQPDEVGIQDVKKLYRQETGKDISDEEAYRVLRSVMQWLWALNREQILNPTHESERLGNEEDQIC